MVAEVIDWGVKLKNKDNPFGEVVDALGGTQSFYMRWLWLCHSRPTTIESLHIPARYSMSCCRSFKNLSWKDWVMPAMAGSLSVSTVRLRREYSVTIVHHTSSGTDSVGVMELHLPCDKKPSSDTKCVLHSKNMCLVP